MSSSRFAMGRAATRLFAMLGVFALLHGFAAASAHGFLDDPTIVPLMSQQVPAAIADGRVLFEQRARNDEPADLWALTLSTGARSAIATAAANQHSPATFGRFVVFVEERRVGQVVTFSLALVDVADPSRRAILVPATTTPLWPPAVYGDVVMWSQGGAGDRDIYGLRIDRDGNGMPDVFEQGGVAEAAVPVVVDPATDSFAPSLGASGLAFASRRGDANASVVAMPVDPGSATLADTSRATVLSADTGNRYPDPATAGAVVVWRQSSGLVRVYDLGSHASVDATSGPGWSMVVSPATDGRHVAWQAFGVLPEAPGVLVHQVFMRDVTGAVFRVAPTATGQYGPVFGPGMLVWSDARPAPASAVPNLVSVCLRSRLVRGGDRFETAVQSSRLAFPSGSQYVVIATGRNWPDALGGAALAGALDAPVLLVERDAVPVSVRSELLRLGAGTAIILGQTGAVGAAVQAELEGMNLAVERIGGADRYVTAELIAARTVLELGPAYDGTVILATGKDFPDALAAAPVAVKQRWPILLVDPAASSLTDGVRPFVAVPGSAIILGGPSAVSTAVEVSVREVLGAARVERLGGADRYETTTMIASFAVSRGHAWDRVGIATGVDFPDALTGGVLQGRSGSVMLLTPPHALHSRTAAALTAHAPAIGTVVFFGGTGALSQITRDSALEIIGGK